MAHALRPVLIIGNWKMHKTIVEARTFVSGLAVAASHCPVQVGLAVPFTMIAASAEAARGTTIAIGAQNAHEAPEGAFTGEISCQMLKDAGASFVIIGHSERRRLFHEDDALVNRKAKSALDIGLRTVVCVGETIEQHKANKTNDILREQLMRSLDGITSEQLKHVVLAYEPVWAIGTGLTATPEMAQAVQHFCRGIIAEKWGTPAAEALVIQYGGSVKPDNAEALLEQPDVDGLLVGGASLELESFSKIVQISARNLLTDRKD